MILLDLDTTIFENMLWKKRTSLKGGPCLLIDWWMLSSLGEKIANKFQSLRRLLVVLKS